MVCSTLLHVFGEQLKQWLLHINWAKVFKRKSVVILGSYGEEDEVFVDEKEDFIDGIE